MDNSKISSFFITNAELKKIQNRKNMLEIIIDEVKSNSECVELSDGNVWKWFKVYLWKPILVESGLSDEGKMVLMRMCVMEKMKYQNMGDKGLLNFIRNKMEWMKKEEKKRNGKGGNPSIKEGDFPVMQVESAVELKIAA